MTELRNRKRKLHSDSIRLLESLKNKFHNGITNVYMLEYYINTLQGYIDEYYEIYIKDKYELDLESLYELNNMRERLLLVIEEYNIRANL